MRKLLLLLFLTTFSLQAQKQYKEDFKYFWESLNREYAYFDIKQTKWNEVKNIYTKELDSLKNDAEFLALLENVKDELYDAHIGFNRNLESSFRLIPNDLDAYISYEDGKYIISDMRSDYKIQDSALMIGDEIYTVNGKSIVTLVEENLPKSIKNPNKEVREYFANLVFAGKHNEPRNIGVLRNKQIDTIALEKATIKKQPKQLLEYFVIQKNFGYIKINNSLGNNQMIQAFPKVVDVLKDTKGLIIDLRATQNGGNAEVAKAIMGKFIKEPMPYQVHERVGLEREFSIKRRFVELLYPLENPYDKPVYILVSRWTGSVGEAIAQGFSNMENATIVGTPMAKLLGAVNCRTMPNSGIRYCYPFEKLFNVDGTPRENFQVDVKAKNFDDIFYKMLEILND